MRLSREKIFPIGSQSATGLSYSGTIQGEGKLCGVASLFVRLQGCNLRCRWKVGGVVSLCDTQHTWGGSGEEMRDEMSVGEIAEVIEANRGHIRHVVITGGEPYLQAVEVAQLVRRLQLLGMHVTIETNGTVAHDELSATADLLSISPKLSSSGISSDVLERSVRVVTDMVRLSRDVQLKFVVGTMADELEIKRLFAEALELVCPSDVLVMPLGATRDILSRTTQVALEMAVSNGWRYSPRLHIDLFGNKEGV